MVGECLPRFEKLTDNVYFWTGRTHPGLICFEGDCYLIDTGLDDEAGRKLLSNIKKLNFSIIAIINSHYHADHIGGNNFIQSRTNIKIFAPHDDLPFIKNPKLEPALLYGGDPLPKIQTRFLMAKPSTAETINETELPKELKIIPLPGHTEGMIGIRFGDVFFVADAYIGLDTLTKYKIPYTYNPEVALSTLKSLKDNSNEELIFVSYHDEPSKKPEKVIDENINAITATKETIFDLLREETSIYDVTKKVLSKLKISVPNMDLFFLYESLIKGYLSWLARENVIEVKLKDNIVVLLQLKK